MLGEKPPGPNDHYLPKQKKPDDAHGKVAAPTPPPRQAFTPTVAMPPPRSSMVRCVACGAEMVTGRACPCKSQSVPPAPAPRPIQAPATARPLLTPLPVAEDVGDDQVAIGTFVIQRGRLVMSIGAAVGMLATFLPWMQLGMLGAADGTKGPWAWVTFVLFGIGLAATLHDRVGEVARAQAVLLSVPSTMAGTVGLSLIVMTIRATESMPTSPLSVGPFVVVGAALVVATGAAGVLEPSGG